MSSRTWVCFDCRKGVRRPADYSPGPASEPEVTCPDCGKDCVYLGYKIRVPARRDVAAWAELRDSLERQTLAQAEGRRTLDVKRRHELEQEIAKLQRRPSEPGRSQLVRRLRDQLDGDA